MKTKQHAKGTKDRMGNIIGRSNQKSRRGQEIHCIRIQVPLVLGWPRATVMKHRSSHSSVTSALTVAGSDSGGGAGLQADLKTFARIKIHGTSVVTCITAQNPSGVLAVQPVAVQLVEQQFQALNEGFRPSAVKSGMLYSDAIVRAVSRGLRLLQPHYYIADPVMVATSGAHLLRGRGVQAIQKHLIPLANLVTPNVAEAEVLLNEPILRPAQAKEAVKKLVDRYEVAFLLKGGHLPSQGTVTDYFHDGTQLLCLDADYIRGRNTHGTGCTYAAAITGFLAAGSQLEEAIFKAKSFITDAIRGSYRTGHYEALNVWEASGK
ncbi:MAG: bifunctional hydroxymethylpyrimidine kinase/phosphomethylpyrimidine kinase [Verrucomicrobiota bacterium]|nr:bifunctional hydroxymethylpyrimidine kinase/phosphomethylpyrimidine kinase [Verrucomicrobiota bacterium]